MRRTGSLASRAIAPVADDGNVRLPGATTTRRLAKAIRAPASSPPAGPYGTTFANGRSLRGRGNGMPIPSKTMSICSKVAEEK